MSYEESLKTDENSGLLSWRFSEIKGLPTFPNIGRRIVQTRSP